MNSHIEDELYRNYVAVSLQNIPRRKVLDVSYYDLLKNNLKGKKVDNRTGDEVAIDVISACGLTFKKD